MTSGLFPGPRSGSMLTNVETASVAESLPERYRRVLDRIAELETAGRHPEADRVRRDAIQAYSRRWNDQTARRLDSLADRAHRLLFTRPEPRGGRRTGVMTLALVSIRAPRRAVARLRPARRNATPAAPLTPEPPRA
jgi:hypothetical protein